MGAHQETTDKVALERRVDRLATERTSLFGRASTNGRLSPAEHQRLAAIERELDECFNSVRRRRAVRDAQRFDRDQPFFRRPLERPSRP